MLSAHIVQRSKGSHSKLVAFFFSFPSSLGHDCFLILAIDMTQFFIRGCLDLASKTITMFT